VLVEALQPVVLDASTEELPLQYKGTPISYFTVNDFLNTTLQLRTLPEMFDYFDKRLGLPDADLRTIGEEQSLFAFYLLNDGSFLDCRGISDARIAVAAQTDRVTEALWRKSESDSYSTLMENVAHELATRLPNFAARLSPEDVAKFDALESRENYLEMQRVLASLRLRERAELGRAFEFTARKLNASDEGMVYRAAYLDSQPDLIYILASSKKVQRSEVVSRLSVLARGAMAHYGKSRAFVVVDRDGEGYEVGLWREFQPTLTDHAVGEKLFGTLRIESTALHVSPR
jgi:hypothetical protein